MIESNMNKLVPLTPSPGFLLIDPLIEDKKSDFVSVTDTQDMPFKGTVIAVGEPYFDDKGNERFPTAKIKDFVLYSIMGTEEFKAEYKGNIRHRFVVAPFSRILGIFA